MKCEAVVAGLSEYVAGELPAGVRAEIERHLGECAACQTEAEGFKRVEAALEQLAVVEAAPEMLDDLRRRLAPRPQTGWRWTWVGVAAAAAAALMLCLHRPVATPMVRPVTTKVEAEMPAANEEKAEGAVPGPGIAAPGVIARATPVRHSHGAAHRRAPRHRQPLPEPKHEVRPEAIEPEAPQPAVMETAQAPVGMILLLGEPEPVLPSGTCRIEVAFPDGAKSIAEQSVERDSKGEARAVQVTYQSMAPEASGRS